MSNGISYSRELVEAAKQAARNTEHMTRDQYVLLMRFRPEDGNYYRASAEILLNLLEGAEVHEPKPKTCGECAKQNTTCPISLKLSSSSHTALPCFQPRDGKEVQP